MVRSWPAVPGVPAAGHVTARGYWHPGKADGCVKCDPGPVVRVVRASDVQRCPHKVLAASHYRDDGSCRCPRGGRQ